MTPSEDASQPLEGRKQRPDGDADSQPAQWIWGTGLALFIAGVLVTGVSPGYTPSWLWKVGLLLMALGVFVFLAIPGGLLLLGLPLGAAVGRTLERRFKHTKPRQIALALVWFGIWGPGFLAAGTFPDNETLTIVALGVLLVGFPLLVIELVREGRT